MRGFDLTSRGGRWHVALNAAVLFATLSLAARPTDADYAWPVGHDLEGLPISGGAQPVYSRDLQHPLNQLHALLFVAARTPTEIGASLPAERRRTGKDDAAFFQGRWALQNRLSADIQPANDTHWFGGDVRTSPVEAWSEAQAVQARRLLADLDTPAKVDALLGTPLARLSLQWDLLHVWWRFERNGGTDPATLQSLARAIRVLGQPREILSVLPSGLETLPLPATQTDARDRHHPRAPRDLLDLSHSDWLEIDREPKVLFQAQRSLCSARVFVKAGDRVATENLVTAAREAGADASIDIPRGTEVALLLCLVGLTRDLEPVATPVASELRLRAAVAPDVLDPASDTSTRDGWNQWVWLFSRSASCVPGAAPTLRFVPDTAQSLFLEYGTPKYTTYFAQCALCHRTTNGGKQNPSGINALSRYSKPRALADPAKRLRDAEKEMASVVAKLRARLDASP